MIKKLTNELVKIANDLDVSGKSDLATQVERVAFAVLAKLDPKAKARNRGKVVFPAEHKKVLDSKDHFPINDLKQARNALARASQFKEAPEWFDGTLKELVGAVVKAVHKEYPSVEISKAGKRPGKG